MSPFIKKQIYRYVGNFGVSFFAPLTSTNVANSLLEYSLTLYDTVIISAISSCFTIGMLISRDFKEKGERKKYD